MTDIPDSAVQPSDQQEFPPPQINIMISADRLAAYLRLTLFFKGQRVEKDAIYAALEGRRITFGIDDAAIDAFCAGDNLLKELKIAKGVPPIKGEDGYVDFHFRKEVSHRPLEREDGTVDYKVLDIIQNVKAGDKICTIHPPGEGTPGTDIHGEGIKPSKGMMPTLPSGDNIIISEQDNSITAKIDGGIHYYRGTIHINNVHTIFGDVGPNTGNIDYNGSVVVEGNVLEGFEIKAARDINVKGIIEGVVLWAGGNITVRNGINGMRRANIFAEGDISSLFVENALLLKCGGNLYSDVLLNSTVEVGNLIHLRGPKGAMIGGSCRAGESINVKTIGNDKNMRQDVFIDPCWYEYEKSGASPPEDPHASTERLLSRRATLQAQLEKIGAESARLNRSDEYRDISMAEEKSRLMREIIMRKSKILNEVFEINAKLKELEAFLSSHDFKIVCTGDVYPGSRLTIGSARLKVNSLIQNQKFYADKGEIAFAQVLPHEK